MEELSASHGPQSCEIIKLVLSTHNATGVCKHKLQLACGHGSMSAAS